MRCRVATSPIGAPSNVPRPLVGVTATIHEEFLRGCVPDNVIVIDAARLLAHPGLIVNEHVEA